MICPVCGNEIPEGSRICPVCHADPQTLPEEVLKSVPDETPPVPETQAKTVGEQDTGQNAPIPEWLIDIINHRGKTGQNSGKMGFDSYANVLFGMAPEEQSSSPEKVLSPRDTGAKEGSVYQPSLESTIDSPLVEEDKERKTPPDDHPVYHNFGTIRPVRKWDDPVESAEPEKAPARPVKEPAAVPGIPALWLEDAPLVEDGEDTAKDAGGYDSEFANSVSPTKVIGSEETSGMAQTAEIAAAAVPDEEETAREDPDEFRPESGSLLSDLMNEMNSGAGMPAPAETKANDEGTVFYSGSDDGSAGTSDPALSEMPHETGAPGGSAAILDQVLRRIGYSVEDEPAAGAPAPETGSAARPEPVASEGPVSEPDPALVIEPDEETEGKPASGMGFESEPALGMELDPALVETDEDDVSGKGAGGYDPDDDTDETDIPWDLFGSADMSLPMASGDGEYRTFSRTGLPEDTGASTYQQRMLSSVLGKIIQAENFVPPEKKVNARAVSVLLRVFWAILAAAGVVLILTSDAGNKISLPAATGSGSSAAFWQAADKAEGEALVVVDYTPSYASVLEPKTEELIETLLEKTDQLYLSALNPAAMTTVRRLLDKYEEDVTFGGWWPAGVISIRSRLADGAIPDRVWLITSESGSVRGWAEQMAVSEESRSLYVLSPVQLEPLLSVYQDSGMVSGVCFGEQDTEDGGRDERVRLAVLYLAALLPCAWLAGVGGRFLRTDPDYRRKKNDKPEEDLRPLPGKETEDD